MFKQEFVIYLRGFFRDSFMNFLQHGVVRNYLELLVYANKLFIERKYLIVVPAYFIKVFCKEHNCYYSGKRRLCVQELKRCLEETQCI